MAEVLTRVWYDEAARRTVAVDRVNDMLYAMNAARRPALRALKLASVSFHPSLVG